MEKTKGKQRIKEIKEKRKNKSNKEAGTTEPLDPVAPNGSRVEGQEVTTRVSRVPASKIWCFAIFPSCKEEIGSIVSLLNGLGQYFMREEICPETGRLHLQGFINFKIKCRPMEKISYFGRWQKTKGSFEQNMNYCTKGDGPTYTNMELLDPVIDPMIGLEYYYWQTYILEMISKPADMRSIHWFYSPTRGKLGKTTFAKHLCLKDKHILFVNGKHDDIKCFVTKMIQKKITPRVVIFYFEKDSEKFISYRSIEAIKDGIFFSGKYDSSMCIFNPPHVICMANYPPDTSKLMSDRWNITNIELPGINNYQINKQVDKVDKIGKVEKRVTFNDSMDSVEPYDWDDRAN